MDDRSSSTVAAARRRPTAWARASLYAVLLVLAVVAGFSIGVDRWEAGCPDPDQGPCSGVPEVTGLFWAAGAVVLVLASAVALELVLRRRSGPAYRRA